MKPSDALSGWPSGRPATRRLTLQRLLLTAMAGAAGGASVGCGTRPGGSYGRPEPTYEETRVSPFLMANRDAIDALFNGLRLGALGDAPLLVATIVNVNDLRKAAPLGRTLSEQYRSLLVDKGFLVKELKLRGDLFVHEKTGELLLSRELKDIAQVHSAGLVLVGTYSAAGKAVYISLKLVRTDSGQILRGHDYALPANTDVRGLLDPA